MLFEKDANPKWLTHDQNSKIYSKVYDFLLNSTNAKGGAKYQPLLEILCAAISHRTKPIISDQPNINHLMQIYDPNLANQLPLMSVKVVFQLLSDYVGTAEDIYRYGICFCPNPSDGRFAYGIAESRRQYVHTAADEFWLKKEKEEAERRAKETAAVSASSSSSAASAGLHFQYTSSAANQSVATASTAANTATAVNQGTAAATASANAEASASSASKAP